MAKAAKHPKLRWETVTARQYWAGPFRVARSGGFPGLWMISRPGFGGLLGYACTVAEAKAIAQAFADSETLRGEGG